MNRFEFAARSAELRAETAAEKAERVIFAAESRKRGPAPGVALEDSRRAAVRLDSADVTVPDNPAPLSSALGLPTLLDETPSAGDSWPHADDAAPFSSALGLPTLINEPPHQRDPRPQADNPAPLSSALGIPTLLKESPHERNPLPRPDNPAPLSSALGIPTLLKEPRHARDPRPRPDNPAPFSSLLGLPVLIREQRTRVSGRPNQSRDTLRRDDAQSFEAANSRSQLERSRPAYALKRTDDPLAHAANALSRADEDPLPPRHESSLPAGFSSLDMLAAFFAALMTLGPLFAAFIGRMRG